MESQPIIFLTNLSVKTTTKTDSLNDEKQVKSKQKQHRHSKVETIFLIRGGARNYQLEGSKWQLVLDTSKARHTIIP